MIVLSMFCFPKNVLCQKSYSNYAWGAVNRGHYITIEGEIFEFNGITNSSKSIGAVPSEKLAIMISLCAEITEEPYEPRGAACDAGCYSLSMYPGTEKELKLREDGDFMGQLSSDAARTLMDLIDTLI